ncbi:hypothetical protein K474DRAFT_1683263 [Panus rudis PR-1116 ss-1]|nr:hypothetical protein K474DRAFT_1683263 [Panus rudis PR-1116 ss-1]
METAPEEVLSDALEILYDYTPVSHSSAGALFTYRLQSRDFQRHLPHEGTVRNATAITLKTPETQASNWSLHASSIWVSSLFVADHLDDLHIDEHVQYARQRQELPLRVLELGAGAGLPSIAVAKRYGGDVQVVASDYPDESLISTLKENIENNGVEVNCHAIPYAWGTDPSPLLSACLTQTAEGRSASKGFDLVIAADTLWNPDSHSIFLDTLRSVLSDAPDARIYLAAGLHTGRYTVQSFMKAVEGFGLELEEVKEREVKGTSEREWDVARAEGEDDKERRKWLIWMKLKRRKD